LHSRQDVVLQRQTVQLLPCANHAATATDGQLPERSRVAQRTAGDRRCVRSCRNARSRTQQRRAPVCRTRGPPG